MKSVSAELRIAFVGLGYVGLSTAVCLASRGFRVHGIDIDEEKLEGLRAGAEPFHEKGLMPLLRTCLRGGTLELSSSFDKLKDSKVIFITVGTPSREDGSIDTSYVEASTKEIGRQLASMDSFPVVVVKSTVVPGTTTGLVLSTLEKESGKKAGVDFGLAANPEFLHEGSAIKETFHPDALLVGGHDKKSTDALMRLYRRFYRKLPPTIRTTPSNAEMMKYAINGGRAAQVSFINTIANLCSKIPGCDMDDVRKGLSIVAKMDQRYLSAGLGFGGSCVPPDTRIAADSGFRPISGIRVGDRVLSHDGRYHLVTKTFVRDYDGPAYFFKSHGFTSTPLLVTPGHPVLSRKRNTGGRTRFYRTTVVGRGLIQKMANLSSLEPPLFADPSSLSQGDFMVLPQLKEESSHIPAVDMASRRKRYSLILRPDLMYLFGLWLAEGSADTKRGEVSFSFHAREGEYLNQIDGITSKYLNVRATKKKSISKGNTLCVTVKCRALAFYLDSTFGRGAANKHIPWDWLELPTDLLTPLVRGLWYGDGSNHSSGGYPRFTYATVSPRLADFMELAFLKLRVPYRRHTAREKIDKNGVQYLQSYFFTGIDHSIMNKLLPLLSVPLAKEPHRTSWFDGNLYVFPIKEARTIRYSGNVHNLEVEGSNSYVVEGATLHNCLPKDLRALASFARSVNVSNELLSATLNVNERQASKAIEIAEGLSGPVAGKKVSILGLAFKANTDDVRESVSILLTQSLLSRKAVVTVYDPRAMDNARSVLGDQVHYAKSARDCLSGSECCFVATGWDEFKRLRPGEFKSLMASPVVVDGRRIYDQRPFRREGILIGTIGTGPWSGE